MECRDVNCNQLYVKLCQWGELPLNKALEKQTLFYVFHFCVLIKCVLKRPTNAQECMHVI
jgi:hypothetical protein